MPMNDSGMNVGFLGSRRAFSSSWVALWTGQGVPKWICSVRGATTTVAPPYAGSYTGYERPGPTSWVWMNTHLPRTASAICGPSVPVPQPPLPGVGAGADVVGVG